jgi:transposase InsO family protein
MLNDIINWYHRSLNHIGIIRLCNTIALHFYHAHLRSRVEQILHSCDICLRYKLTGRGYGELPPREALIAPWQEVAVDLIGPWKIKIFGQTFVFDSLTMIDTVTNFVELARINNRTAAHVGLQFENNWLSRYPRPMRCIFDQGPEFKTDFQNVLRRHGIKPIPTTTKNPQANAICERMHQTVENALRPLLYAYPPRNAEQAALLVDTALQTAAYSVRTAVHGTLKISPGALVFHRDMILDIPVVADLELLRQQRQALIDQQLIRENRKRISHDYRPGDNVLLKTYRPNTLEERTTGPFAIIEVHTNGTVTIQRNAHVIERINIRRLKPYRS